MGSKGRTTSFRVRGFETPITLDKVEDFRNSAQSVGHA